MDQNDWVGSDDPLISQTRSIIGLHISTYLPAWLNKLLLEMESLCQTIPLHWSGVHHSDPGNFLDIFSLIITLFSSRIQEKQFHFYIDEIKWSRVILNWPQAYILSSITIDWYRSVAFTLFVPYLLSEARFFVSRCMYHKYHKYLQTCTLSCHHDWIRPAIFTSLCIHLKSTGTRRIQPLWKYTPATTWK